MYTQSTNQGVLTVLNLKYSHVLFSPLPFLAFGSHYDSISMRVAYQIKFLNSHIG